MKRKKLLKHLFAHGCVQEREGAKHTLIVSGDGLKKTAVPRHVEIDANLARKICHDVGVPPPTEK
jgi:mRNA interferase HicA